MFSRDYFRIQLRLGLATLQQTKDIAYVQMNVNLSDRNPNTQALISALSKLIEATFYELDRQRGVSNDSKQELS